MSDTRSSPPLYFGFFQSFPQHPKFWTRRSESNRRVRDLQSPALPLGYPASAIPTSFYFAAARIAFIIRWAKHNRESADATGFLHAFALHLVVKFHHLWVINIPMAEVVVVVVHNLGFVTIAFFADCAPIVWIAPFPDSVFFAVFCPTLIAGEHPFLFFFSLFSDVHN